MATDKVDCVDSLISGGELKDMPRTNSLKITKDECELHSIRMNLHNLDVFNVDSVKFQKLEYERIFKLNAHKCTEVPILGSEIPINRDDSSETEEVVDNEQNNIKHPLLHLLLCFIFPFFGCFSYIANRKYDSTSPRLIYAKRALCLGSALCVIYSFLICSLLGQYVYQYDENVELGFSYT